MSNAMILQDVLLASKKWVESFNKAEIEMCALKYLEDAVMDARPIGRFEGREEIYEFWNSFVHATHATDLTYTDIQVEVIDENSVKLSANWSMNIARGFISEELWVRVNDEWFFSYDDFTIEDEF